MITPFLLRLRSLSVFVALTLTANVNLTVKAQEDAAKTEDVIIVTGTRIPRPDAVAASPVASFDRSEINAFRNMTIEDFINDLSLVTPDFNSTSNNPGNGTASVNLRGLGSQRSLILLNGRRVAPVGANSSVDVNTIPSALLKRVEIVTGGASTVYGSDAVAGAVNFITRDDLQGVELSGQFDIFGAGDGETYNASLIAGTEFSDGRGHVSAYADYVNRSPVRSDAREFSNVVIGENRLTGELVEQGNRAHPNGFIIFPGAILDSEFVLPIFNQDGSFRASTDEDRYNFAPDNFLQTALERWSGGAFLAYELTPSVELYSELMFSRPVTSSQLAPAGVGLFASFAIDSAFFADSTRDELRAAYDPDNDGIGDAFILKRLEELGPRQESQTGDYYRAVAGFQAAVSTAWTIDGYYSYSRNSRVEMLENGASRARLLQGLLVDPATGQCEDPSGGCVPVNFFGRGNITPEAVEFFRIDSVENMSRAEQHNAALIATGELFSWSGGTALASGGVEFRRNTAAFNPSDVAVDDLLGFSFGGAGEAIAGGINVYEVFIETVIPLIEGRSFTERLELEVGGRFSHYSTAGDSWTWKAGGQWFPVENLRFRGMWQRAVRAPNIEEVLQAPSVFTEFVGGGDFCLAVNDPVGRGFSDVCIAQGMDPAQVGVYDIPPGVDIDDFEIPYDLVVRGNPNLEPERAGTITVGADYTFETPYHLQLGVDYFDIRLKGAIAFTGSNFDLCELIADPDSDSCTLITRDPTGFPISSIQQPLNLSVARVKGVDLNLRFSAAAPDFLAPEGGADIGIRSQATHYIEFGDALTTSTPFVDCAGGFSGNCGLAGPATTYPDKVVNTTFSYDATRWSASLRWRWISGQENLAPVFDELANLPPPNLPITSIGSRNYLDAAIRFDIADGVELRTGVDNILGTNPPLLADEQSQANTDPGRYTVLGRRIFVRVEMRL